MSREKKFFLMSATQLILLLPVFFVFLIIWMFMFSFDDFPPEPSFLIKFLFFFVPYIIIIFFVGILFLLKIKWKSILYQSFKIYFYFTLTSIVFFLFWALIRSELALLVILLPYFSFILFFVILFFKKIINKNN